MSVAAQAPPALEARIEARELSHRYGSRLALEPLSFAFDAPCVVAVRGRNGAGKTTLLRLLAGLLRPTSGQTRLWTMGQEVTASGRTRAVGYAGPELAFYPELTARENLEFAAEARGLHHPPAQAADRALARVGLEMRGRDRVAAFSSGMVQRLRLAFALIHEPAVLLLDEPGSHLDEPGRAALLDLVAREGRSRLVMIATNDDREGSLADQRIELRGSGLGHPA